MTETKSYETIAANVAAVRENMRQAALQAGRDPEEITLVAATKVQTSQTIRNAIQAGITVCGENRVQELVEKRAAVMSKYRTVLEGRGLARA